MNGLVWCQWHRALATACADQDDGDERCDQSRLIVSPLGRDDEPQHSGALVVVWAGDYRWQEVWVASGANIGNWYCLGNEFRRPKVWDPPQRPWPDYLDPAAHPLPERPAGTIPLQPDWGDVLARGPVSMLTVGADEAYRTGWANGRRDLLAQVEQLADEDPPA